MSRLKHSLLSAACFAIGLGMAGAKADTITMWVNAPLAQGPDAPIHAQLRAFEEQTGHTVNLEPVPHQELERRLTVALAGGAGPDVMAIDIAWVAGLADAGFLKDITDQTADIADQYQPGPLAAGRYEGRLYALPLYTNNVALFVNNAMLAEAGIEKAPETWEELRAAAQAMTALGPDRYGLTFGAGRFGVFQFDSFVWQNGGEFLDEAGNVRVDEPEAVEALDFLVSLYRDDKAIPDTVLTAMSWDEVHAPFVQGRAGMVVTGDWGIGAVRRGAPDMDFSIVPLPRGTQAATVIGGFNLAVNERTTGDAAIELIKFLTGPRSVEFMGAYSRFSAHVDQTTPENLAKLGPEQQPFMAQAAAGRARPVVAAWTEVHASVLSPAWDGALRGLVTPEEALKKAAEDIKALIQ